MSTGFNTRKLTTMGVLAGLSVALVFLIRFPIFPQVPFLEYEPADIPILIATFAFGPLAGLIVTVIASVVQGFTVSAHSGIYGILMHIISASTYVFTAGIIYRAKHSRLGAGIALVCGVLVSAAVMIPANLVVTPIFMGVHVDAVKEILVPFIIPFNLIKSGANGAIVFFLYKPISKLIKGVIE
jgi:riboflavin transporter FmnP